MTTAHALRMVMVGAAVATAQWLSAAAATPIAGGSTPVGVAGPMVSWPWLVLALPLAAPAWPGAWLFTGPGVALVWACAAGAAVWAGLPRLRPHWRRRWWDGAAAPALLGAVWLGIAAMQVAPHAMSGDAPHYLTMTQSLVRDGDFDLKNDYDARSYGSFYAGTLRPRHTVMSPWGAEYSFHAVGVSVLVAPAFRFFGAVGATWTLVLVMAAGAALLWIAVRDLTGQPGAAWFAWASLVMSAPYTFHAAAVYPDGPASMGVVGALWLLARDRSRPPASLVSLAAVGTGLAALPWLHVRLALPAAMFGLAAVVTALDAPRDRWSRVSWLLMVPVISFAGWVASSYVMFGTWNPAATMLGRQAPNAIADAPGGLFGLMFDREFGLLPTSPVYLLAAFGVVPLLRANRRLTVAGVGAFTAVVLMSSIWVWWAGDSAPVRFLAVVLPVPAVALGVLWASSGERWRRVLVLALVLTATMTALMASVDGGTHIYNYPDGRGSIFDVLSPAVNAGDALPSMLAPAATLSSEVPIALIWLGAAALAGLVIAWWPVSAPGGTGVAALVALIVGGGAASAAWAVRGKTAQTPATSQLHLVRRVAEASNSSVITWPRGTRDALTRQLQLRTPEATPVAGEVRMHVPNVPAGRYAIRAAPADGGRAMPCRVELGRDAWPYAEWSATDAAPVLNLAVAVHSVRVLGCGSSTGDVWLEPVVAPRASEAVARRVSRIGTLDVYALDDSSFADAGGFWTGADRATSFMIASDQPSNVRLRFSAGPAGVAVDVRHADGQRATLAFEPWSSSTLELGALPEDRGLPLRLEVSGGFSAELLTAGDGRRLGVWFTVEASPVRGAS